MSNSDAEAIIEDSQESSELSTRNNVPKLSENFDFKQAYAKMQEDLEEITPKYEKLAESPGTKSNKDESYKNDDEYEVHQQSVNQDEYAESASDNLAFTKTNKNTSKNEDIEDEYDQDFEENEPEESSNPKTSNLKQEKNAPATKEIKSETNSNKPREKTSSITKKEEKETKLANSKPPLSKENVSSNVKNKATELTQKVTENSTAKSNSKPSIKIVSENTESKTKKDIKPNIPKAPERKQEKPSESTTTEKKAISKSVEKKPPVLAQEKPRDSSKNRLKEEEKIQEDLDHPNQSEPKEKLNFRIRPSTAVSAAKHTEKKLASTYSNFNEDDMIEDETTKFKDSRLRATTAKLMTQNKPPKPASNVDIYREVLTQFKEREKINKEKDEELYAIEEAQKRIKPNSEGEVISQRESEWVGNGLGKPKKPEKSQGKKSNLTRDLAANFLASIEKKIGAPKERKDAKPSKEKKEEKEFVNEEDNLFDIEHNAEEGDQALPDMSGKDLSVTINKSQQEKSKMADSKENTMKKEKKKEEEKNKDEAKWGYQVGNGVLTDYDKAQKEKSKANQLRFTELFKNEKKKKQEVLKQNLQKQKEVLIKERENRKKQQVEMTKPIKVEEKKSAKDSAVLQVQNVYEEESKRDKNLRDKKDISDLKDKLKILKEANTDLKKSLYDMDEKDKEAAKLLEELTSRKAVISLGKNTFTTFGFVPSSKPEDGTIESTEETSRSILSQDLKFAEDNFTPVELIVNKIVDQGFTLESLYQTLDANGDGVLTLKEIKEGFDKLNLELSRKEVEEVIRVLDINTDGLISLYEFKQNLTENVDLRREYKAIMGNLDKIANPLVLEERILDLEIRKKVIQEELKKVKDDIVFDEKEYSQKLNLLKKYDNLAGPKEDTKKTGLDQYKETILKSKVELQDLFEIQNRTVLLQEDRINDIKENISNIEIEITKTIQEIYRAKRKLREKIDDEQKDQIRKLFMEKLYSDLDKELESNEQGLNNNVMKLIEERQKYKTDAQEEQVKQKFDNYAKDGAARKIQNAFKSKKARQEFKMEIARITKAKTTLIVAYRRFKKRNRNFVAISKLRGIIKKRKRIGFDLIKEKAASSPPTERLKSSIIYTEAEFAVTEAMPTKHKEETLNFYEKYIMYILSERFNGFKKFLGNKVNLEIPELKGKCKICEKNKIQKICKKCELSLFCNNCYTQSHGRSRNHPFVEVNLDIKSTLNNLNEVYLKSKMDAWNRAKASVNIPENIKALKTKYKESFKDLLKTIKDWDKEFANYSGYIDARYLETVLKKKTSSEDAKEIADFAYKTCVLCQPTEDKTLWINYVSLSKILTSN